MVGNCHLIRWHAPPTLDDVRAVTAEVRALARRAGEPLVCIAVIPAAVDPPTDDARRAMTADLEVLLDVASSITFVIEGAGFKALLIRSVVTALILMSSRRAKMKIHSTLASAIEDARAFTSVSTDEILRVARSADVARDE
jgi:hypothetical protein